MLYVSKTYTELSTGYIDLFGASSHFINLIVQIGIISRRAEFNVRAAPFGGQEHVCSYRSYRMNSYFQGLLKDAWDSYEQRLILNGLSLEENHYSPNGSGEWSPDAAR